MAQNASSSPETQGPVAVRLWPTAVVMDGDVRLEEIAQISSGDGATVAAVHACPIAAAPPAGGSTVLTLSDVTKAMATAGITVDTAMPSKANSVMAATTPIVTARYCGAKRLRSRRPDRGACRACRA